jgi:hypothetical protein
MNEQQTSQSNVETFDQPLSVRSASSAVEIALAEMRRENESLRHELRLRTARDELTRTLVSENARSPELLFEAASARLVFDDDGKLTNLSDIVTDIKARFPEQFVVERIEPESTKQQSVTNAAVVQLTPPAINAGAGRIGIRPPLTKEILADMNPRDIANLNWSDVKQVMEG